MGGGFGTSKGLRCPPRKHTEPGKIKFTRKRLDFKKF